MTVIIRREEARDAQPIAQVVREAFSGNDAEPRLVELIRQRGEALVSMVAVDGDELVGHVLVSPIRLSCGPHGSYGGVAPLSVAATRQQQGIGGDLMRAAISASAQQGLSALFLLGSPDYYRRFGFVRSQIGNEYGATDSFMHLELAPGCLDGVGGLASYVSAFNDAGA